MLKLQRHGFTTWKSPNSFHKLLFEIISLQLFQKEISLETVVHFGLAIEQPVGDADDRVVESERVWVNVRRESVWNVYLLIVLHIKNKLLLNQTLLQQNSLDVENVNEFTDPKHELDFVEFVLNDLFVVLVLEQHPV